MSTISVVIPAYNAAAFIGETLTSVLAQDVPIKSIVVCDNLSSDGTVDVIRSYAGRGVRFVHNPRNLGPTGNFNACIREAEGDYICLFHADDVMAAGNLSKKLTFLEAHPEVGFVHSNAMQIDPGGQALGLQWKPGENPVGVEAGVVAIRRWLEGENTVVAPSVVMRKRCCDEVGFFEERITHTHDLEYWLRLAARWDVGYLDEPLVLYRRHPGQDTRRYDEARRRREEYACRRYALDKESARLPESRIWRRALDRKYGARCLSSAYVESVAGRKLSAWELLKMGCGLSPVHALDVTTLRTLWRIARPLRGEDLCRAS